MQPRLERDPANKMIGGVCAGLARYLAIDVTLVRLFFVAALVLWGFGFLAYIVLLIVMPEAGKPAATSIDSAGRDIGEAFTSAGESIRQTFEGESPDAEQRRANAGWILVALGVLFFLSNAGVFRGLDGKVLWPLILVGAGAWLLLRRTR